MSTQSQKVAVVSGANKGIGFAIVKGLCEKFKGIVYLTSRDVGRGEAAVDKLQKLGYNPKFLQLDITDQSSIDKLKDHLVQNYGGFDLLINNAAIAFKSDSQESFGKQAEKTLSVNYFALLKVCDTLFPILKNNAQVVSLSSSAGHLSRIPSVEIRMKLKDSNLTVVKLNELMEDFIKLSKENKNIAGGWGGSAYVVSKVGVSALTRIQQAIFDKEQPNRNISVNSVHPGYVDTDMTSHKGVWTIEQGARAPLYLALELHGWKGKYVWSNATVVDWTSDNTPTNY